MQYYLLIDMDPKKGDNQGRKTPGLNTFNKALHLQRTRIWYDIPQVEKIGKYLFDVLCLFPAKIII